MNSSMIGKIEKAHRYANEPERISVESIGATIRGDNDNYHVSLGEKGWSCTCHTFQSGILDTCSHVMAMQMLLGKMLDDDSRYPAGSSLAPTGD